MKTAKWIIGIILLAVLGYFLLFNYLDANIDSQVEEHDNTEIRKNYYDNGKLKADGELVNGKLHGVSHNYYKSGSAHSEMHYVNGLKDGLSTWFYQDGSVYRTTPYTQGLIHGVQKKFYKDGSLQAEIPYKNGKLQTGTKEYSERGKLFTDYPEIIVAKVDKNYQDKRLFLRIRLSKKVDKLSVETVIFNKGKPNKVSLSKEADDTYLCVLPAKLKNSKHTLNIQAAFKSRKGNKVLIEREYPL